MRSIRPIRLISVLLLLIFVQSSLPSCTKEVIKEYIRTDTVRQTIIQKDTVIIKDTVFTEQILTAHTWKAQETKGVRGGNRVSYVRGGTGNTESFDNERIVFRPDKTGTYTDPNLYSYEFVWAFTNTEKTALTFTIDFLLPTLTVITWDNIVYKDGKLKYAQYWTQGTLRAHSYDISVPL